MTHGGRTCSGLLPRRGVVLGRQGAGDKEVLVEMRRKIAFVVIAVVGVAAVALGVKFGDPETIHRFASQI